MADQPLPLGTDGVRAMPGPAQQSIDPRQAQFLTTEHWSLLATRSLTWSEAFSRSAMFLSALSAATVALALVGPPTSFGGQFVVFALVVLSVTLFLGLATYVRLVQVNNEDLYWVAGMNQIRGAYTRLVPGIEDEFFTGWTVDAKGISRTFAAIDVMSSPSPLHMLVTTPAVVGIISSAIAGVIAGLLAIQLAGGMATASAAGLLVFVVALVLLLLFTIREGRRYVARITAITAAQAARVRSGDTASGDLPATTGQG